MYTRFGGPKALFSFANLPVNWEVKVEIGGSKACKTFCMDDIASVLPYRFMMNLFYNVDTKLFCYFLAFLL